MLVVRTIIYICSSLHKRPSQITKSSPAAVPNHKMAAKAPAKPEAAANKQVATDDEPEKPIVLDDLIAPLAALPAEERTFAANALVDFADLMKRTQIGLLTRDTKTEELPDQDRCVRSGVPRTRRGGRRHL
jgi:hypothetical protein